MKKEIVVAKYQEDMHWLKDVQWKTLVYDKDPSVGRHEFKNVKYIETENHITGREAHTFAKYIFSYYNNLSDLTFFLQGNPYEHCWKWNLPQELIKEPKDTSALSDIDPVRYLEQTKTSLFRPNIPPKPFKSPLDGKNYFCIEPDWHWKNVRWKAIFGNTPAPATAVYGYGAQYCVPKHRILQNSRYFYLNILKQLEKYESPAFIDAWFMETVWFYVFGDTRKNGLPNRLLSSPKKIML